MQFANTVLNKGIKILNITKGSNGSLIFIEEENKIKTKHVPAFKASKVEDVTGCGDAFAAGFITEYLKTKDSFSAVTYANKIAGLKSSLSGGIKQLNLLAEMKAK